MANGLGKLFKVPVKFNVFEVVHHTIFMVCGMTTREKFSNFSFPGRLPLMNYFVVKGCRFTNLYFPIYKILSTKFFFVKLKNFFKTLHKRLDYC